MRPTFTKSATSAQAMIDVTAEVLMVEDNSHDAELTMLALNRKGLDRFVYVVRDGAEAVDFIFAKGKYEHRHVSSKLKVIILDLKLPKLDGFEVLQKMRSEKAFDTIPVVVHSSSAVEADIKRAYELGANSYVVKPIDFAEHSESITSAVSYWIKVNRTV